MGRKILIAIGGFFGLVSLITSLAGHSIESSTNIQPIVQAQPTQQAQVEGIVTEPLKIEDSNSFVEESTETVNTQAIIDSIEELINDPAPVAVKEIPLSNDNYYTNVDGDTVHSPAYAPSIPPGASAICGDGTYSFSKNRRGTCSRHGGVAQWL